MNPKNHLEENGGTVREDIINTSMESWEEMKDPIPKEWYVHEELMERVPSGIYLVVVELNATWWHTRGH